MKTAANYRKSAAWTFSITIAATQRKLRKDYQVFRKTWHFLQSTSCIWGHLHISAFTTLRALDLLGSTRGDLKRLNGVNFQARSAQLQVQEAKLTGAFLLCKDGAGSGKAMRRHEGRGPVTPGAAQKAKMRFCSLAEGEIAHALAYSCACAVALKDNSASFKV